ncbi:endonuclease III [Clostridium niameyense]|uniref:Endonuclease III n=1 Tax=Clostridium niameyense TaxID=1622073 RepID=A0A6M0R9Z1_9CLOT|nr:endonuclease III [Clostridium niameyense]NEZ47094.1 endonuclease III [Clostridium niameyense]
MEKDNVEKIISLLKSTYPDAKCELNYNSSFELLIATVLSAQTTDKKVNEITKDLFKEFKTPKDFLTLNEEELQDKIRKIGLYRNKSKNILALCRELKEKFKGEIPKKFDELVSLPGVGRKTANVVLANAFNVPTIAVDTHVFRVSNRIGIANSQNVNKTEQQLQEVIPKSQWILMHHLLIFHGRRCCIARNPKCSQCTIKDYCNYYKKR